MRFLVFDGELVNVGAIQEINFDGPAIPAELTAEGDPTGDFAPGVAPSPLSPTPSRAPKRKPFSAPQTGPQPDPSSTFPRDRARILVLGRSEPLETSDPQRIARLRELWRAKRAVRA